VYKNVKKETNYKNQTKRITIMEELNKDYTFDTETLETGKLADLK
jgi:hypothetical protein